MADDNTIDTPDLPESFRFSVSRGHNLKRTLSEVEKEYIMDVLSANKNNISHAAQILGIDRKTLREKIRKDQKPK
jgi:DNA-binding NtrC family response regulator